MAPCEETWPCDWRDVDDIGVRDRLIAQMARHAATYILYDRRFREKLEIKRARRCRGLVAEAELLAARRRKFDRDRPGSAVGPIISWAVDRIKYGRLKRRTAAQINQVPFEDLPSVGARRRKDRYAAIITDSVGSKECPECSGKRYVTCPDCWGTGKKEGQFCGRCKGTGRTKCTRCDGSGSVQTYHLVQVVYRLFRSECVVCSHDDGAGVRFPDLGGEVLYEGILCRSSQIAAACPEVTEPDESLRPPLERLHKQLADQAKEKGYGDPLRTWVRLRALDVYQVEFAYRRRDCVWEILGSTEPVVVRRITGPKPTWWPF